MAWLPRKLGTVASATYRDYKQHLDHYVIPRIGGLPLESIVKGTIEELRATLADIDPTTGERRGLADKTIRNILGASLRAMLRECAGRRADRGRPVPESLLAADRLRGTNSA